MNQKIKNKRIELFVIVCIFFTLGVLIGLNYEECPVCEECNMRPAGTIEITKVINNTCPETDCEKELVEQYQRIKRLERVLE